MSSHSISRTKKCWACAYYAAKREVKDGLLGKSISCDNEGVCSRPKRSAKVYNVYENSDCPEFVLWGIIDNLLSSKELEKEKKELEQGRKDYVQEQLEGQRQAEQLMEAAAAQEELLEEEAFARDFETEDSNPKKKIKGNFEKKSEKIDSWDRKDRIKELPYFGWELVKEFKYKNGDSRFTIQRNMSDEGYVYWKENEKLFNTMNYLILLLPQIKSAVRDLKTTYKEYSRTGGYKLSGIKALFDIRPKIQKQTIKNKVNEINKGYDSFREELEEDYRYILNLERDFRFFEGLKDDSRKMHPEKDKIAAIVSKYRIEVVGEAEELKLNIESITYDFETKKVVLNKAK